MEEKKENEERRDYSGRDNWLLTSEEIGKMTDWEIERYLFEMAVTAATALGFIREVLDHPRMEKHPAKTDYEKIGVCEPVKSSAIGRGFLDAQSAADNMVIYHFAVLRNIEKKEGGKK